MHSGEYPPKPMIHIVFSPNFHKIYKFPPYFLKIYKFPLFSLNLRFFGLIYVFFSPILIIKHLYALCFTRTERPCLCMSAIQDCIRDNERPLTQPRKIKQTKDDYNCLPV